MVFISHHHGPGKKTFQDGIAYGHAELLAKVRSKCGGSDDIVNTLSRTKALEGKGQVTRNAKKPSIV